MKTGSSPSQMNQCHGLDFKYYKSKDVSSVIFYTLNKIWTVKWTISIPLKIERNLIRSIDSVLRENC